MGVTERREREFRRREDEILAAALRLFDSDDWQLVTIERIAQEAEIGKGTVYLHFPTKEAIYARLAVDFSRQLLDRLTAIDAALAPLDRLRAAIRIVFDTHRGARAHQRIVDYCDREDFRRRLGDSGRSEFLALDAAFMAFFDGVLRDGIAAGQVPDRPLNVLSWGPHATVIGAVRLLESACLTLDDAEAFCEEITRFVLAGLVFQEQPLPPRG